MMPPSHSYNEMLRHFPPGTQYSIQFPAEFADTVRKTDTPHSLNQMALRALSRALGRMMSSTTGDDGTLFLTVKEPDGVETEHQVVVSFTTAAEIFGAFCPRDHRSNTSPVPDPDADSREAIKTLRKLVDDLREQTRLLTVSLEDEKILTEIDHKLMDQASEFMRQRGLFAKFQSYVAGNASAADPPDAPKPGRAATPRSLDL